MTPSYISCQGRTILPKEGLVIAISKKRQTHAAGQLIVNCHNGVSAAEMHKEYKRNGHKLISHNAKLGYDVIQVSTNLAQAQKHYNKHSCVKCAELNHIRRIQVTPNDPYYNKQYGLRIIKANQAWNTTKGRRLATIAVIDTGAQRNHPDLKGKLLTGYNFVGGNANTNDDNGHGTHVSGIAAAITNNKTGVAGTAWRNRILPVKSFDSNGTSTTDLIVKGILYAADQGAKVINMSFGGGSYSQTEADACAYAIKKGAVLVASAGNDGSSAKSYPAAYPGVLSVAATDAKNAKASFSNYGKWVSVTAPGVEILSTYIGSKYSYLSGTSMSAPFVSGVAGLLAAKGRTNTRIVKLIKDTARPISGTGTYWRYGLVDAAKAVRAGRGTKAVATTAPALPAVPAVAAAAQRRVAGARQGQPFIARAAAVRAVRRTAAKRA